MTANGDRTNNRVVQSDSSMVTDDYITHGIVNTSERLYDGIITKTELTIGWRVHPDGMMDKVVDGVKTALAGDKAGGVVDKIKNLF